ncbi:Rho GTPase-activating protein 92B [Strongyloides ratti]|uniref:Rho GTPase-activating protein 92B n=1 Tax=Strongyloides ratti TaxID=34506 RepID=A0A090KY33_STRRB|nr:Rho GTPase-activating protein 92B [Strongyloides ratti]CEF60128.1 Rho GTPase-activating protein 92B [Strongyloides ratti]
MDRLKDSMNNSVQRIRSLAGPKSSQSTSASNQLSSSNKKEFLLTNSVLDIHNIRIGDSLKSIRDAMTKTIRSNVKEENVEKKKKKLDLYQLAHQFFSEARFIQQYSVGLERIFKEAGNSYSDIVDNQVTMDTYIEEQIIEKLTKNMELAKEISKNQNELKKVVSNRDNIEKKMKTVTDEGKAVEYQTDFDSLVNKVDSIRESTLALMFTLKGREYQNAMVIRDFMQQHLDFYEKSAKILKSRIENIDKDISDFIRQPIFGVDIEKHCQKEGRKIAGPIQICAEALFENGMKEQGLFRVPGNQNKVKRLRAALDSGAEKEIDDFIHDPHTICAVLKLYLRELPSKLFPKNLNSGYLKAVDMINEGKDEQLKFVYYLLNQMPEVNRDNIAYLMKFLRNVTEYESVINMNASNLALMLAPNLFDENCIDKNYNPNVGAKFCEILISNANVLFTNYDFDYSRRKVTKTKAIGGHYGGSVTSFDSDYTFTDKNKSKRVPVYHEYDDNLDNNSEKVSQGSSICSLSNDNSNSRYHHDKPCRPTYPPPQRHFKNSSSDSDKITFSTSTGETASPQLSQKSNFSKYDTKANVGDVYENYANTYPQSPPLTKRIDSSSSILSGDEGLTFSKSEPIPEGAIFLPKNLIEINNTPVKNTTHFSNLYPPLNVINSHGGSLLINTGEGTKPTISPKPRKAPSPPKDKEADDGKRLSERLII